MFKTGEHFVCDFDEGFKISPLVGSLSVEKKWSFLSSLLKIFPKAGTNQFQTLYFDAVALCRLSFYIISRHYQLQNSENFFYTCSVSTGWSFILTVSCWLFADCYFMAYYARVFALCHLSGTNTLLHLHFAMFSESNSTQSNCTFFTSKFKKMNIRALSLCANKNAD